MKVPVRLRPSLPPEKHPMNEQLKQLLEKLGAEGKEAWVILVQEQLAYNLAEVNMFLYFAVGIFAMSVLITVVWWALTKKDDSCTAVILGLIISIILCAYAADAYIEAQAPSITLLKELIG